MPAMSIALAGAAAKRRHSAARRLFISVRQAHPANVALATNRCTRCRSCMSLLLALLAAAAAEEPPVLQLPKDVRPTHYELRLTIDPSRERFSGTSAIDLTLDQPRTVIWLHGLGL